jgi:hypothetical protein
MESTTKKLKAREEFRQFVQSTMQVSLDSMSGRQLSLALLRFYVQEIYNLQSVAISEEDFEAGIVDGAGDLVNQHVNNET